MDTPMSSIKSALNAISPSIPRDEWFKICCSTKANGCNFSVFHEWSKNGSNYKSESDCLSAWNSKGEGINSGYLFKIAQDAGWVNKGDGESQGKQHFFDSPVGWFNSLPPYTSHQYINVQGLNGKLNGYESVLREGKDRQGAFIADPIYDVITGELVGFNRIYGTGGSNKRIAPNTLKSGNAGRIGEITADTKNIYICEGMADTIHVHNDFNEPCFIASDAGNLPAVVKNISEKYPDIPITIIADSDQAGIKAAIKSQANNIKLSILHKDYTDAVKAGYTKLFTIGKSTSFKDATILIRAQIIETINSTSTPTDTNISEWLQAAVKFDLHNQISSYQSFIKAVENKTGLSKADVKKIVKNNIQKQHIEQLKKSGTDSALTTINSQGNMVLIEQSTAAQLLPEISDIIKKLRFDDIADCWMQYDSNHWELSTDAKTDRCIKESIEQQAGGIGFNIHYLKGVRDLIRTSIIQTEWNTKKNLICLKNGVIDINTMQLLKHDKNQHITSLLPFDYNPQADCPITKKFLLDSVGGDEGQQQILRAFINAVIKRRSDLQRFLAIVGMGGTGKGTFLRLLVMIVGSVNVHSTNFKNLEGSMSRFDIGKLYGKKLLIIPDSDQYAGSVEKFKSAVGQDVLRYEEKNKNNKHNGNFRFQGMAIIASNEPIAVSDNTSGWTRRIINLTFNNASNERDGQLEYKIESELSGIFNWALAMSDDDVKSYLQNTSNTVESAKELAFKSLIEGNQLAAWTDDNLILKTDNLIQIGTKKEVMTENENGDKIRKYQFEDERLYPNYVAWAESMGKKPISQQRFSGLLADLFKSPDMLNIPETMVKYDKANITDSTTKKRKKAACFKGLDLRNDDTDTPSPIQISKIQNISLENKNSQKEKRDESFNI